MQVSSKAPIDGAISLYRDRERSVKWATAYCSHTRLMLMRKGGLIDLDDSVTHSVKREISDGM
jgi:hypothetical protein